MLDAAASPPEEIMPPPPSRFHHVHPGSQPERMLRDGARQQMRRRRSE